jgi:hypothetical protein
MNHEQRRIHWPILGAATAVALAVTFGIPAAMNAAATSDGYLPTLASANAPVVAQVVGEPLRIDVVATREHPTVGGFSFTSHKRAG